MDIKEITNDKPTQLILSVVETGLEVLSNACPGAGLVSILIEGFCNASAISDEIKINHFIKGMASDGNFNREKFTNLLSSYLQDEDNAFYVSNLMRKAVLSDSRKVCTVMGRILADNVNSEKSFSTDDIIIGNALQLASDEDLVSFMEIMKHYRKESDSNSENEIITFPYRDPEKQNLRLAAEWAMNGRILGRTTLARFDGGKGVMDCLVTPVADKLLEYCEEVRQIW